MRLALVLVVALAYRLAVLWYMAPLPIAEYQATWSSCDMAFNYQWASVILGGDVLCRDTPHPYTQVLASIAPKETWERWWGGAHVFHKAPLYAYVLAGVRAVAGNGFISVALGQIALGLLGITLLFAVAARAFDARVATVAATGAAIYGPLAFYDLLYLRDGLAVTTALAALWALLRAHTRGTGWVLAGVAFALALLTRETMLLFAPLAVLWIARQASPRPAMRASIAWLAGVAIGIAPLVVRNLTVGAPPLSLSTVAAETIVYGHAADGSATDLLMPPSAPGILRATEGRLWPTLQRTLATHPSWTSLAAHELRKLTALLSSYEPGDNTSWQYFADLVLPLRFGLCFPPVLALGLVGLGVAPRPRSPGDQLLRYFLIFSLVTLLLPTIIGRYRLPAIAALLIYAGLAMTWIADCLSARRWLAASAAVLAALAATAGSYWLEPAVAARRRYRSAEFTLAAQAYAARGDNDRALAELRRALLVAPKAADRRALVDGFQNLPGPMVRIAAASGHAGAVAADLEAAVHFFPDDYNLHAALVQLYRDVLNQPQLAAQHLAEAERLAPGPRPAAAGAAGVEPPTEPRGGAEK